MIKKLPHYISKRFHTISIILMCTIILSSIFAGASEVLAEKPRLYLDPPEITVGVEGEPVPPEGYDFNVTVKCANVNNLYGWNIRLYFDNRTLNCTNQPLILPENHVFEGKQFIPINCSVKYDSQEGSWYVECAAALLGEPEGVNIIEGVLCKIMFKGIATGTSKLRFSEYGSGTILSWYNKTSARGELIPGVQTENCDVAVIPEFSAFLMLPLFFVATLAIVLVKKTSKDNTEKFKHTEPIDVSHKMERRFLKRC